jgi:hypothetical protein
VKAGAHPAPPVRGTQELVDQMGWVIRRPTLTFIEIAWRWLFGIPFLLVCWAQLQHVALLLTPEAAGLNSLDAQNPWVALVQLGGVWGSYEPYVAAVLQWLAPVAALGWIAVSGVGRALLLMRVERGVRFRPVAMMVLQGALLALLLATFAGWYRSMQWVAANHIIPGGDSDLVGYSIWAIFLSLGFFTLWALVSWPVTIAPMLVLLEGRSAGAALVESCRLGKTFIGKLMEINLVMGIAKMALIVLAMVFAAAPLPFSDQLGMGSMKFVWSGSVVFYLVANDYFQVVRLKSFIEFWHTFRGGHSVR